MTNVRKRAIKMYWKMAKKKCPFQTEEIVNGYLEGFIDCAEYLLLQIAELEKELEQAKKVQVVEHFEAYGQCRDSRRIASLETENAELKDKLKNLESVAEVRLANWQKYKKENAELKAQVEKMKCCQNCKFEDNDCIEEPCSACTRCLGNVKRKGNSDKWELQEG